MFAFPNMGLNIHRGTENGADKTLTTGGLGLSNLNTVARLMFSYALAQRWQRRPSPWQVSAWQKFVQVINGPARPRRHKLGRYHLESVYALQDNAREAVIT